MPTLNSSSLIIYFLSFLKISELVISSTSTSPNILDDVRFIETNYKEYYHKLQIESREEARVIFDVSPINDIERYGFSQEFHGQISES